LDDFSVLECDSDDSAGESGELLYCHLDSLPKGVSLNFALDDICSLFVDVFVIQKIKDRVKMVVRAIGIAKSLLQLHNFHSFMGMPFLSSCLPLRSFSSSDCSDCRPLLGIMAGLSLSPVSRLKHTWAKLPEKHQQVILQHAKLILMVFSCSLSLLPQIMKELEAIQDPSSSFKVLRSAVDEAGTVVLPYVGVHLSDLTFMDEGNPDFLDVRFILLSHI